MSAMAAAPTSVVQALHAARAQGLDRVDAHLLLGHALGRSRSWLIAHDDALVDAAQATAFAQACGQRLTGVPVAYLLGEREFHGLRLRVTTDVLVPRPDTETLVDWALALLAPTAVGLAPRVLDLGTGSGAIALAVAHRCPAAQVVATDLSAAALAVAQANAGRLGLALRFCQGSWWRALPEGEPAFDLVLSNPPYIAEGDPHLVNLQHEPRLALTPGGDGLDAYRQIVPEAMHHLRPGGWLLLEHGHDQSQAVAALLHAAGLRAVQSRADLAGWARCTGAQRPAA